MTSDDKYYDLISPSYEELHKEEQLKKIAIIKDNFPFSGSDIVLDLGSGPGFLELDCTVIRLEPSIQLLRKAGGLCVQGIAEKLPFKDKCFDKIVSITAVQNFDDIELAVREIKRVCRGGIVLSFMRKYQCFSTIYTRNIMNNYNSF